MSKDRRSRFEIVIDVLEHLEGKEPHGSGPTRLMYATNLSWATVKSVVSALIADEILSVETREGPVRNRHTYRITDHGKDQLAIGKELRQAFGTYVD